MLDQLPGFLPRERVVELHMIVLEIVLPTGRHSKPEMRKSAE